MIIRLRSIRENLKSSLFYTPMMLTLFGLVLGQLVLWVDEEVSDIPADLTATVDSARAVLGVIAGATIALAGIAFSVSLLLISHHAYLGGGGGIGAMADGARAITVLVRSLNWSSSASVGSIRSEG